MLVRLSINNYALIDKAEIDFSDGFSVITGETGAGKSIMLSALSLLLGERAEARVVRDSNRKTIVEGVFRSDSKTLKEYFDANDLEWADGEIILRREIAPGGRSRAFVNDTPVKLNTLADMSSYFIDIHSQHENTQLLDPKQQLALIDTAAGDDEELKNYRESFQKYVSIRNKIDTLKANALKYKENKEFLTFQLEQLDKLRPKRGELAELERRYELVSEASSIKENLATACGKLDEGDNGALGSIAAVRTALGRINFSLFENQDGETESIPARLESVYVELKDIFETLSDYADRVDADPRTLEKVTERLNGLYDAQKRFKVADHDSLVDLHERLRAEFASMDTEPFEIEELEKLKAEAGAEMKLNGEKLTAKRIKGADSLSKEIIEICRTLGLPNLRFTVLTEKGKYTHSGCDNVSIRCSFNKNQDLQPIEKTASGGEVSRLMLGIKSIMARKRSLPTVIFDEIDTGVSGDVADRMGRMMSEMGKEIQVMAITHLPQVAAHGQNHYKVYKEDQTDSTVSHIVRLNDDERIDELAIMLSGKVVDSAALDNAKSLLNQE